MIRVDALNNVYNTGLSVDFIEYVGSNMILVHSGSGQKHLASFDPNSESIINPDLIDISGIQTIYGINYNEQLDRLAICDAMGYVNSGRVYLFISNGTPSTFYHVGLNPSNVIFYE